jgi:hypothetical protein
MHHYFVLQGHALFSANVMLGGYRQFVHVYLSLDAVVCHFPLNGSDAPRSPSYSYDTTQPLSGCLEMASFPTTRELTL